MAFSCSNELKEVSILCDNCFVEMTTLTYIKCSECEIDLCLSCFVNQVETSLHSKYHKYRVISKMDTRIHEEKWTLMEEILFIEGLSVSGIGNWSGVSKYVGGERDVEDHFYKVFGFQKEVGGLPRITEKSSNPYRGTISSYMPYRKDFDIEYMNGYEALIKDLSLHEDEGKLEKRMIEAVLDSYIKIIRYRNRRKHAILGRNLIDMEGLMKKNEQFKVVDNIKWIVPYLTKPDFNTLLYGIYIEKKLHELLNKRKQKNSGMTDPDGILSSKYFVGERERELCETHGLSPDVYLGLKREMAYYLAKKKRFTKEDFNRLFGFLKETDTLYNLFLEYGWIHKEKRN
ncbi:histone acetyltransferase complex SAGA/ADA subunit ADA2 [Encephalitozoon romaleae SJ-2008]|uniref:Histone acetyltransferase complex SAGA/ADA subunit ADA2 n=1 Tax=Encephalitozoon romaleae (strain SJ-2008) TaxID=1178016 RepID=I6ZHV2_ENCRO|nr:histone acetyltransferase complex SAGA/ADA subunit ADA2 [Encephalitozoon romaleae SJ-2008]AFN82788.1 histone acetyltransferase complex SAGA/ADA subunit ADA2 [Encephalitozoon romaleae SJ-2008]